jgi:hypothetical protein
MSDYTKAAVSTSGELYHFTPDTKVIEVTPRVAYSSGGMSIDVRVSGVSQTLIHGSGDNTQAWCRFGENVYTKAKGVLESNVECLTVPGIDGNVTLEISTNGQDFTTQGMYVERITANVTSVYPNIVSVTGGSTTTLGGINLGVSGLQVNGYGVFCGYGASNAAESWSQSNGRVTTGQFIHPASNSYISCQIPMNSAGFRVVEVALSANGEMSRSGIQVEYSDAGTIESVTPSSGFVAGGTQVTVTGTGFMPGFTNCRFGTQSVLADVKSSADATCASPAGIVGTVDLEVTLGDVSTMGVGTGLTAYRYDTNFTVTSVSPRIAYKEGGSTLSVITNTVDAAPYAWCRFHVGDGVGGDIFVKAKEIDGEFITCMSISGLEGNVTVDASTNGQDFSDSGMNIERIMMNVTSVLPKLVPVAGTSVISLRGVGLDKVGAGALIFCGFGASAGKDSWSMTAGVHQVETNSVTCNVPARNAGFRAVEVSLTKSGEMSRSGVQVEYADIGRVHSVFPQSGHEIGGTVVTIHGTGFVAGRTACKFGSGLAFWASVLSDSEIRCVVPAGQRGAVSLEVALSEALDSVYTVNNVLFNYEYPSQVAQILPRIGYAMGGMALKVVSTNMQDGKQTWCRFGGEHGTIVEAITVDMSNVECISVAGILGNTTVEVSNNMVDFTNDGYIFERVAMTNVTSAMPHVVSTSGGTGVQIRGFGLSANFKHGVAQLFCGFGASTAAEAWSTSVGNFLAEDTLECIAPAHHAGFRAIEVSLSKEGEPGRSGMQVEYAGVSTVEQISPIMGFEQGGTLITVTGHNFVAGLTACKFGSAPAELAEVISSGELRCVAPAGQGERTLQCKQPEPSACKRLCSMCAEVDHHFRRGKVHPAVPCIIEFRARCYRTH